VGEDLQIRTARPGDAQAIGSIFATYVNSSVATFELTAPTSADWAAKVQAITEAGWPFLVGQIAGEVVGFAYVSPWRAKPAYRHTVEDTVYLATDYVGRGLGSALLGALLESADAAGARQVIAVIADSGDPASRLAHQRLGFAEVGRLSCVGFKHDRWIDIVLMQRELGQTSR